jgi:hypothetical protein
MLTLNLYVCPSCACASAIVYVIVIGNAEKLLGLMWSVNVRVGVCRLQGVEVVSSGYLYERTGCLFSYESSSGLSDLSLPSLDPPGTLPPFHRETRARHQG